jgi:hypothetical protein
VVEVYRFFDGNDDRGRLGCLFIIVSHCGKASESLERSASIPPGSSRAPPAYPLAPPLSAFLLARTVRNRHRLGRGSG